MPAAATEVRVRNGTRPEDGDAKKATTKLTIAVSDATAIELRRRVKERQASDPYYSRNDLVRAIILDYFRRHPLKDPRS